MPQFALFPATLEHASYFKNCVFHLSADLQAHNLRNYNNNKTYSKLNSQAMENPERGLLQNIQNKKTRLIRQERNVLCKGRTHLRQQRFIEAQVPFFFFLHF